jgi:hypothetical protein
MTKTALLKNSTAIEVVQSAKLPAAKPKREYADFDRFVANADKLVAFFERADQQYNRLAAVEFKWLEKDERCVFDLERAKQEIAVAKYSVESARGILLNFPQMQKRLAEYKRDVKWYDRKDLYEIKGKGKREQWTLSRRVVSEQMALLLASFQNSRPGTPKAFGRMIIEEVYANNPNACTLESACRRVRRTHDFPPSIAEMLKAIDKEGDAWCSRWEYLDSDDNAAESSDVFFRRHLEETITEAESTIAKAQAKLDEREAKEKAAEAKRQAYREAYERMPSEQRRAYENGKRDRSYNQNSYCRGEHRTMPQEYLDEGREAEVFAYVAGKSGQQIPGLEIKLNGSGEPQREG